jgi:hypothetical protein
MGKEDDMSSLVAKRGLTSALYSRGPQNILAVGTTTVAKPIDTTEPFRLSAFHLITLHLVGLRQMQIPLSDMQGSQT